MKYEATVKTNNDGDLIAQAFEPEAKELKSRSSYKLRKEGKGVLFEISAADATALRATLNSITKALTVVEKTKEI